MENPMTMAEQPPDPPPSTGTPGGATTSGASAAAALMGLVPPAVREGAWAAGSDAPEKTDLVVGFMPLTDCASVVVAAHEGFDRKYGIRITPRREASWAAVRDRLVDGSIDAAHVLYGLVYGVQMGIGGLRHDMAVLMTINRNGQGITLANQLRSRGVTDGASLRALLTREPREYTFAQTFPTGTHAMWLYYWLAAHGIDPGRDVRTMVVPPPQMVRSMRDGHIDGFCAGEPWNAGAIRDRVGFTAATSQDVWPDHPEKVLGATAAFVERHPNTARALVMALLEASRFIDTSVNRPGVAGLIAGRAFVDTEPDVIRQRFLGRYENGLGLDWLDAHPMRFHDDGRVNFPWLSDGMWFLTQYRRWGLLAEAPDYLGVARRVNRIDLYREAATQAHVAVPEAEMRASTLMDGKVWNGSEPEAYARSFTVAA